MIPVKFLFVDLWPWWLGGIAIGILVPIMYYFLNTALGVSTGYVSILKALKLDGKFKWLASSKYKDPFDWRLVFIAGMVIGGFLSARVSGMGLLEYGMGLFTDNVSWNYGLYALWFFGGGVLLGFGARMAGGCTSGHSIHGIATIQKSSIIATILFLLFGFLTTFLIRMVLFGGV